MKRTRIVSILLAVVLSISFALPAFAADNTDVDAKIAVLEQKYDIRIFYDTNSGGGACIGTGALATLDAMLTVVTPEVVRELSAYTNGRIGSKLAYRFMYDYNVQQDVPDEALAAFDTRTGVIELYLPSTSRETFDSGDNPLTMIHELGHVVHMMLEDKYGAAALETEWLALNGSESYKTYFGDGKYTDTTFFSEYAATAYDEDFAETFAHSVIRNRAGLGFSYLLTKDGARTNLGRKVDYMINLVAGSFSGGAALAANMKNNAEATPIYTSYQGIRLYGIHLQYINCAWPSYVLKGIMNEIGEEVQNSLWIYEIGGWYATGSSGKYYLIFPGGTARLLSNPLQVAAAA